MAQQQVKLAIEDIAELDEMIALFPMRREGSLEISLVDIIIGTAVGHG